MATKFQEGAHVQIADREATAEDAKTGLFYNHFRGLTGTIQKVYNDQEAAIEVDPESLAEPIHQRHEETREQMRTRWLEGLSEEARGRLSETDKNFRLRYTVLVGVGDLLPAGKKAVAPAPPKAVTSAEEALRRATTSDLTAAEEAELLRRQQRA